MQAPPAIAKTTGPGERPRRGIPAAWVVRGILTAVALACVWGMMVIPVPWAVADPTGKVTKAVILDGHILSGIWFACAFNLVVAVVLLATHHGWLATGPRIPVAGGRPEFSTGRTFWLWLAPVLLLAVVVRVPLLDHSLYADEHYSITRFIHGDYRQTPDGPGAFREVSWKQTIWGYQRPNNHIAYSITARLLHQAWQEGTGRSAEDVSVAVLRLPALVAAVLSIWLAARLLWRHGFRYGAIAAALLMACHPWHIAHSVEVRGYAFVFLFGLVVATAATRVCRPASWGRWAALAAAQFALLYTYPKAIYIVGPTVIILAATWILRARRDPEARRQFGRLMVSNAVMAGALAFALFPCVPQLQAYLGGPAPKGPITFSWMQDVFALFVTGRYWNDWGAMHPLCRALALEWQAHPVIVSALFGFLVLLGLRGGWVLLRRAPWLALLLLPVVISIPTALAHARQTGAYLYTWYMIMPLPLWLICVGVGMEPVRSWRGAAFPRWLRAGPAWLAVGGVPAFLFLSHPQREIVLNFPAEPVKEAHAAVEAYRETRHPRNYDVFALSSLVRFHDPAIREIETEEELLALMADYQKSGGNFLLVSPGVESIRKSRPSLAGLLAESGRFLPVSTHHGLEFEHRIYDVWVFYGPQ